MVGDNIRKYRQAKNLTQAELAERIFVSTKSVGRWERNENFPGMEMLKTVANELDVDVLDLLMDNGHSRTK